MSKLIERLDELGTYRYWMPNDGSTYISDFYQALEDAYPKLRAVVEAAQLLAGDGVIDDGMYIVESRFRSRMKQALAALEEEDV